MSSPSKLMTSSSPHAPSGSPTNNSSPQKKKSPVHKRSTLLTVELLQKLMANGGTACDLSTIEDIEILFSTITDLSGGGLKMCKSLRSLALIDTALSDVSPETLMPVSSTLERLNLSQQGLTRMIHVQHLPVLRELYLQENAITRIEGLQGCPRLQRIWLYGNKITRIDGLHGCGKLDNIRKTSLLLLSCFKLTSY